ncbi:MAG: hypothetical protein KA118_12195 [Verrucomicrobia bacterium]|nr:hypothetical protein [Verrucomicrobiota bacterium]
MKDIWQVDERLADVYRVPGNRQSALDHLLQAIGKAPPANQQQLQKVKDQIEKMP